MRLRTIVKPNDILLEKNNAIANWLIRIEWLNKRNNHRKKWVDIQCQHFDTCLSVYQTVTLCHVNWELVVNLNLIKHYYSNNKPFSHMLICLILCFCETGISTNVTICIHAFVFSRATFPVGHAWITNSFVIIVKTLLYILYSTFWCSFLYIECATCE